LEPFIFHEGPLPPGYRHSFEVSIFNREQHLQLQSKDGWTSFYILHPGNKTAEAHIHFHIRDHVALSPLKSPFGSFEFSETLEPSLLFQFIAFVEERLKRSKVSRVLIKNPPHRYGDEKVTLINTFLLNHGFRVEDTEISSILPVTPALFADRIHPRKKRKLLQSKKRSFQFGIENLQRLDEVYGFIESLRREKKFKLSISLEALRDTIKVFERDFVLFTLYHNNLLAGASVGIRVNSSTLYHFISDYTRRVGESTPGLLLMEGIYNYCMNAQIALLDLGTSALNGKPNFKLLNFKTELGAIPSGKFTFSKDL
jgi:hypothetical protein